MYTNPPFRPALPRLQRMYPNPPDLYSDASIPPIMRTATGGDPGDGIYVCSCNRENPLYLFDGEHPLGNISCRACDKIPNYVSKLSDVIIPIFDSIAQYAVVPAWPRFDTHPVPYGSICMACGLTHRAVLIGTDADELWKKKLTLDFNPSECACGKGSIGERMRFYIGSPRNYHRDPISVHRGISVRNAEFACGEFKKRYPPLTALDFTPLCAYGIKKAQSKKAGMKTFGGMLTGFSWKSPGRKKEAAS